MKARHLLILATSAAVLVACDQKSASNTDQSKQELDAVKQQLADMQEKDRQREQQAAAAQLDQERQSLAAERAKLEADRAQLDDAQRRTADTRLAQIRDEQRANEKREAAREAEQRKQDQRLADERAAAAPVRDAQPAGRSDQTLDFFYDALDPHGDWVEVDKYGYCFQPRLAKTPGWRPYLDGHWVYTNYGWTWATDEAFGWATYHYGRWTRMRGLGWVWVPGSEWAPAWVSWRRSDRYVGWAPLPPEAYSGSGFNAGVDSYYDIGPGSYNFVEVGAMGEPTYRGRIVEPERNLVVINETTNVTNTIYRQVDNRTVLFNDGPQFDDIERHSRIRRMELERVNRAPSPNDQRGNVLQLLAPFIASAAKPAGQPAKVRDRVRAPEVERGWGGDDAATVTRVREQMQQEARQAEQGRNPARPAMPFPAARNEPAQAKPVAPVAPTPARVAPVMPRERDDARPQLPPKRLAMPMPAVPAAEKPVIEKPIVAPTATPVRPPKATPLPPEEKPARPPKATPMPATEPAEPAPATPVKKLPAPPRPPTGLSPAEPFAATPKPAKPTEPKLERTPLNPAKELGEPQRPPTKLEAPKRPQLPENPSAAEPTAPRNPAQKLPGGNKPGRPPTAPGATPEPAR